MSVLKSVCPNPSSFPRFLCISLFSLYSLFSLATYYIAKVANFRSFLLISFNSNILIDFVPFFVLNFHHPTCPIPSNLVLKSCYLKHSNRRRQKYLFPWDCKNEAVFYYVYLTHLLYCSLFVQNQQLLQQANLNCKQ